MILYYKDYQYSVPSNNEVSGTIITTNYDTDYDYLITTTTVQIYTESTVCISQNI